MFKIITDAGLKCGVTLRPQQLTLTPGWKPGDKGFKYYQQNLYNPDNTSDVDAVAALLVRKASYAYKRWGCTMFYTDTTVTDHGLIPAEAFLKAHNTLPQVVFFPEESDFQYRSGTAPLQDNWGGAAIGTPLGAELQKLGTAQNPGAQSLLEFLPAPALDEAAAVVRYEDVSARSHMAHKNQCVA